VYGYGRVEAYGSGLLRRGLNFSTACCTTHSRNRGHIIAFIVIELSELLVVSLLLIELPHSRSELTVLNWTEQE